MNRKHGLLLGLALVGWTGTLLSHITAFRTEGPEGKGDWVERRDRFMLLASLSTNTLVLITLYRYGKGISERRRGQASTGQ